ncbi:MAG: type II secretion system protein [Gammaproteobacteria bacterium]|nr:type II secretion system protein [Gammaproteobacteria bacterium]
MESGFTLLEVLVAITIMALLLASLLPVFQRGMRALEASDVRTQAMLLAQARLAEAGVIRELTPAPGASMQAEGEHGRFRWQLQMEPYTSDETVGDDADVAARDDTGGDARDFGPVPDDVVGIWDTRVEVHWEDGAKTPSVVLRTLKLGPLE